MHGSSVNANEPEDAIPILPQGRGIFCMHSGHIKMQTNQDMLLHYYSGAVEFLHAWRRCKNGNGPEYAFAILRRGRGIFCVHGGGIKMPTDRNMLFQYYAGAVEFFTCTAAAQKCQQKGICYCNITPGPWIFLGARRRHKNANKPEYAIPILRRGRGIFCMHGGGVKMQTNRNMLLQ
jgi:hypothetical protein